VPGRAAYVNENNMGREFLMPQKVVVTGASGFIAKHVVQRLLNAGHTVTGTLRSPGRAEEVRAAVAPGLTDPSALDRLDFVPLDLEQDAGWAEAFAGHEALIHTASPFPMSQPKDEAELIRPAVEGTRRALTAALGARMRRVVLTSSVAAVAGREIEPAKPAFDAADWTDPDHPVTTPYMKSKTLAERAAWDFVAENKEPELAVINPTLVLGPPLDGHFGTSVRVIQRVLGGKDPMVPRISFGVVDVRDVAEMHLRALERPDAAGKRFIACDSSMWFAAIAAAVAEVAPGRRIARRVAPDLLMRAIGLFDPAVRGILPGLGRFEQFSNAPAREVLGMEFTPAAEAVQAAAEFLLAGEKG
jgi:dihydroflavonol-4-reductase